MNERQNTLNPVRALIALGVAAVITTATLSCGAQPFPIPKEWDYVVTIHKKFQPMPGLPEGPFTRIGEKEILCAWSPSAKGVLISKDDGKTWKPVQIFKDPSKYTLGSPLVTCTEDGIVILAFFNLAERKWTWDSKIKDAPGAELPTYVMRSLDRGKTWEEPVLLHREWTGMNTHILVTKSGNIVFTSMMLRHNPAHHTVLSYMSEDKGKTWHRSNIIDLGGAGNHGGVTETTIAQLSDGRLLGLMRTNWMTLWRIESKDDGKTWYPYGPSGIPAASSHARLHWTSSGRLLLIWNRPYPDGEDSYPLVGGDNVWSATPVSNYRSQLSMAFSDDDGKTWSDPIVIAEVERGKEVAYPYVFEPHPGEIWVTTSRGPLRAKFYEKDFNGSTQKVSKK
jgi:hypothetical protein